MPTLDAAGKRLMLRAKDVRRGDTILLAGAAGFMASTVTKVDVLSIRLTKAEVCDVMRSALWSRYLP